MKYLRVQVEGPVIGSNRTVFEPLEDREYDEKELDEISQDLAAEVFSWGHSVVDESEVPESERES